MNDITCRRPIDWRHGSETDIGTVRKVNEDAVLALENKGLWAVADGMGGHEVGDVASQKIIDALTQCESKDSLSDFVDHVEDVLIDVNDAIYEYAEVVLPNATMGSTVVCLLIQDRVGACLWAGDSRLYRLRGGELQQLSRDHSQVEELVQMGAITREEAATHPHGNVITRAVGVERPVYFDINVFSAQVGDTFLLCSDGLVHAVPEPALIRLLELKDAENSAQSLIQNALENGAKDNISAIVVKGVPGRLRD